MAREYNKIKRTVDDIVQDLPSGGALDVSELPEVGKEDTVYRVTNTEKGAYNWFACMLLKEEFKGSTRVVLGASNIVKVVPTLADLPEEISPEFSYDTVVVKENNKIYAPKFPEVPGPEHYEEWHDTEENALTLITDFDEEGVTLLNGTKEAWEIHEEGSEFYHDYILVFQTKDFQGVKKGCAYRTYKNVAEIIVVEDESELPQNGPTMSFVEVGIDGQYQEFPQKMYVKSVDDGYNFQMYNWMLDHWELDENTTTCARELSGFNDENETCVSLADITLTKKYVYENGKYVSLEQEPAFADLVSVAVGSKFVVDFSKASFTIYQGSVPSAENLFENGYDFEHGREYVGQSNPFIVVKKNGAENQLIASFGEMSSYTSISNEVIIYEGDVSEMEDTSSILSQLPTVEFTLTEVSNGEARICNLTSFGKTVLVR